jgi:hypothetical protein
VRWHYRDAGLLWLWPVAYAAHLAEESWAGEGLRFWLARIAGAPLPADAFVAVNAIAMLLVVVAVVTAVRTERAGWTAIAVATTFSVNAVLHVAGTVWTATYSPGLITAVVLYFPLGQLSLTRAWLQAARPSFWRGFVAGLLAHAAVSAFAFWAAALGCRSSSGSD